MLASALPVLQQDIQNMIASPATADIFSKALLNTFPMDAKQDSEFKEASKIFGDTVANKLSRQWAPILAIAIDKYVKQIGIQIAVKPTVTSPTGPCSGIILPSDVTIL